MINSFTVGQTTIADINADYLSDRFTLTRVNREPWPVPKRELLIDSILNGYPIGQIILMPGVDGLSGAVVHEVIDGWQRVSTIIDFVNDKLAVNVAGLPGGPHTFSELKANHSLNARTYIWQYKLSVVRLYEFNQAQLNATLGRLGASRR